MTQFLRAFTGRADGGNRLWNAWPLILLLAFPLLFLHLGGWALFDPDEGRYASIPREMLLSGDFVTPTQNAIKFFDKPPLLYWAIAASYAVFGVQEWAARLVPAMAALMGLFAAYGLGRRMFGARAGMIGAVVLATSFMWPVMARVVVTDMLVSSLIFVALAFWWLGHSEDVGAADVAAAPSDAAVSGATKSRQTWYLTGFWLVLALAVLAKGPVAVVLTAGCLFFYLLLCRQWQALASMRWAYGLPIFIAVAVPWFVVVAQRNPEFNHFFWYDQHIKRFLGNTTGNDHVEGSAFYFLYFPVILFPWSLFAPAALVAGWRQWSRARDVQSPRRRAVVYLLCGVGFITLFFTASSGKLLTYILPVVPLLALLMAAYFDWLLGQDAARAPSGQDATWNRLLSVGVAVLSLILVSGGVAAIALLPARLRSLGVAGEAAMMWGALLVLWALALPALCNRFRLRGLIAGTAGGFVLMFAGALPIIAAVAPQLTSEAVVRYIRPGLTAQAQVVTLAYPQSVGFYVGRRVKVLGPPDEMTYGVAQMTPAEKRRWIFDAPKVMEELKRELSQPVPVYCVFQNSKRRRLKVEAMLREMPGQATEITSNERYMVVGNRAALALTPPRNPAKPNSLPGR